MPDAFNWTQQRFFGHNGTNISSCGTSEDVFSGLDAAACVEYKDGGVGDWCLFSAMQADVMHVRDNLPVWTQIHDAGASGIYGMHLFRQAFFGLSQKIEGITYFDIVHDPNIPSPVDHYQTTKNLIGGVTSPYGDFLMSLDKGYTQVGIYYSREADYLVPLASPIRSRHPAKDCGQPACGRVIRRRSSPTSNCSIIAAIDTRSSLPPALPTKTNATRASSPNCSAWSIPAKRSSSRNRASCRSGAPIKSANERPGFIHADSEFDEYDDKLGGAFPRYQDWEFEAELNGSEETTKYIRKKLGELQKMDADPSGLRPATETNMLFSPDWLKKGDGQYMIMCNFAPTKFTESLHKTLYRGPRHAFHPASRAPGGRRVRCAGDEEGHGPNLMASG